MGLSLHIYIQPSERIWDYHMFRDELFGYVSSFFREYSISCSLAYSSTPLEGFNSSNEIGVEVAASDEEFYKGFMELAGPKGKRESRRNVLSQKGMAVTWKGIALVNGGWEEFRYFAAKEDVLKQFGEPYEGVTKKEFVLKHNALNIVHEVLHCIGLFHPNSFKPPLVGFKEGNLPNAMWFAAPNLQEGCVLGARLNKLQEAMIHSYLAGNTTYKAFNDSGRDMHVFLERIASANGMLLRH